MKPIYIDDEYKAHAAYSEGLREVEDSTGFFEGKCDEFIEGFWFVPADETYVINGIACSGVILPWRPYHELEAAQRKYERRLLEEYEAELAEGIPLADLTAAYQEGVNAAYDQ